MSDTIELQRDSDEQTGPYVRPDVAMLLAMMAASGAPPMDQLPLADARDAYRMMRFVADADPTPLAIVRDLTCPGPAGNIPLRYYDARETREAGPAIMFFHGGGFVIGDLETHHPYCTELAAKMDLPVIAVDYRLAPEHPFPAAPIDCEAAARWLAENGTSLGLDITGLVFTGDSAGGNLTIVVTQALLAKPAAVPVIAQAPLYPVVDSSQTSGSFTDFAEGYLLTADAMKWFGDTYAAIPGDPRHDCINGELANLPPTLLVTAGLDPLRDQGRDFASRLVKAGVDVTYMEMRGTIHGFICLRKGVPSAQDDCDAIFRGMKAMLAL
ncbi:alpha/beta hydrolase [Sphingomonas sp. 35-24ZXX]|uniref:alpha/beta hydrolase n=1 Tax=Sphingomonas sp. 35-24ZXX TaxID=1545915 RepID=UPI00053BFC35|nr:alpha/beta hydrolase [Sphingomonas sp. 35-24ZXX]